MPWDKALDLVAVKSSGSADSMAMPRSWAARRAGRRPGCSIRRGTNFMDSLRPPAATWISPRTTVSVPRWRSCRSGGHPASGRGPADVVDLDRAALETDGAVRRCESEKHPGHQGRLRFAPTRLDRDWPSARVEVVNISPIREEARTVRPEWIPIRPNTDTAMLLALTHTLVSEGPARSAFLAIVPGFEQRAALSAGRQ